MADYIPFYGLSEDPFAARPDSRFFFPAEGHNEALASLLYGINRKKGFVVILGEAGIGKTTLIAHLIATLDPGVKTILFPKSDLPFPKMLEEMLLTLKLPLGLHTKGSMIHELYHHLIRCLERNETVAVVIDEAENIGLDVIEEVRLLANLETSTSKLLQIILVGEPSLMDKLRSEVIRQIKQLVVISCRIEPLSEKESRQYIDHRLNIAGSGAAKLFTAEALSLICRSARGNPLKINTLCHNALAVGCGRSEQQISSSTVKKIQGERERLSADKADAIAAEFRKSRPRKMAFAAAAVAAAIAAILFVGRDRWLPLLKTQQPERTTIITPLETPTPAASAPSQALRPEFPFQAARQSPAAEPVPAIPIQTAPSPAPQKGAPASALPQASTQTPPPATQQGQAGAQPAAPSPHKDRIKETIEVKEGENLYAIAYRHYKAADETFLDYILRLNPEITNPNLILVDQRIKIPEMSASSRVISDGSGFQVHLRTFRSQRAAAQFRGNVASKGKKIEIVPWKASPVETWYRVTAGPFATHDEATLFIKSIGPIPGT